VSDLQPVVWRDAGDQPQAYMKSQRIMTRHVPWDSTECDAILNRDNGSRCGCRARNGTEKTLATFNVVQLLVFGLERFRASRWLRRLFLWPAGYS
jgi:hypothetical protein